MRSEISRKQKTENEENKVALVLVQKIEDLRLAFFLLNAAIKKKKKHPSIWLMIRIKSHGSKSSQRFKRPTHGESTGALNLLENL